MAKKTQKKPTKEKSESAIELKELFSAVNRKDRNWWKKLNSAQQQKFSVWLYNRYMSCARGIPDLQRYYLRATNLFSNRRLGSIPREHNQLAYLLFTTIPFTGGEADHQFVPVMKQLNSIDQKVNKKASVLLKLYPAEKTQDIEMWANSITDEDLNTMLEDHGYTDSEIQKLIN